MLRRRIFLDTETTGLSKDDKVIEIACLEDTIDGSVKKFHTYLNPKHKVSYGAQKVHGISNKFLEDKPTFKEISSEFLKFIDGAELVIHNATFDINFLNRELTSAQSEWKDLRDHCTVVDTLKIAREHLQKDKLPKGSRSLDSICSYYKIDTAIRTNHGALVDVQLLQKVYHAFVHDKFITPQPIVASAASPQRSIVSKPVAKIPHINKSSLFNQVNTPIQQPKETVNNALKPS